MTIRFSILALIFSFAFFTSCEADESNVAPFTAEQVATSPEWKDYSNQVDRLMTFFVSGAIDMDKVQAISNAIPDGANYGTAMETQVAAIPGGPEYLALTKQIDISHQRVLARFDLSTFDAEMIREVNKAYRKVRSAPLIGQQLPQ